MLPRDRRVQLHTQPIDFLLCGLGSPDVPVAIPKGASL